MPLSRLTRRFGSGRGFAAGAVVTLVVAAHVIWLSRHDGPMLWDDAQYARESLRLFDALEERGLPAFFERFVLALRGKAPLLSLAGVPFQFLLGRGSSWAFAATVLAALVVASFYAYRLARRFTDSFGATLAVFFLCTTPSVAGLSREFMTEVPLLALVLAWHFYLLESDFLSRPRFVLRLGAVLGMGVLAKATFPVFLLSSFLTLFRVQSARLGPRAGAFGRLVLLGTAALLGIFLAAACVGRLRAFAAAALLVSFGTGLLGLRAKSLPREAKRWIALLAVAFWVAGSWYTVNARILAGFVWDNSFGALSTRYYVPLLEYLGHLCSYGVSNLLLAFLAIGAAVHLSIRRWARRPFESRPEGPPASNPAIRMLWLWLLVPLPVLLASANRSARFAMPALLPVALLGGILGGSLHRRVPRFASLWAAAYFLLGGGLFASTSFGWNPLGTFAVGPWVLWGSSLGPELAPPSRVAWPHEEIVRSMDATLRGRESKDVLVLFNQAPLNDLNLQFAADRLRLDLDLHSAAGFEDLGAAERQLRESELLLLKTGGDEGPDWTEAIGLQLARKVREDEIEGLEKVDALRLPDGGDLEFHRWREGAPARGGARR